MFRSLYENFQTNQNIQELNENIVRFQSVEPNFTVFNDTNNYAYPNTGVNSQEQQASNVQLQAALDSLGTVPVPGTTRGQTEDTTITNIGNVFTGIPDSIGKKVQECRKYEGLVGLSNLMANQINPAATERCGWRYESGRGVIPTVAQGAYGNRSGPLDPSNPKVDRVGNGVNYYWDLQSAEKQMVRDVCKAATNCIDMTAVPLSAAGDFSNLCGYCETSQKIIPIKTVNGQVMPRYNDLDTQCASSKIVTMKDAKTRCPVPSPDSPQAPFFKCLNTGKLERDCVTLSTWFSGCSPEGTLMKALIEGKNNQDYADMLRNQKAFQSYQQLSKTPLSEDVIRSGNATLFSAFMNTYALNRNMYEPDNEKRWVAALDLCRYGGIYEQWNFCSDLKDDDKDFEAKCMQQHFLQSGGNSQGTDFPSNDKAAALKENLNWGQYKTSVTKLKEATQSSDPKIQSDALNRFSGLGLTYNPTNLQRGEASQGVEVFYIDWARGTYLGRRPYMSATGKNIPNFNVGTGTVDGTGLSDFVQMMYIFDLRPDNDTKVAFGVVTDDGWAIAKNQPVFNIKNTSTGASWWYDQGPTWHNTSAMDVTAENRGLPNIFMGAWYERGGGAVFHSFYKIGDAAFNRSGQTGWVEIAKGGQNLDTFWKNNCYFTQEIDAPSLQFEPYQPKDYFASGIHFCERRLWSTSQLREVNFQKTAQQVGYTFYKTPNNHSLPNQHVMVLDTGKSWDILGNIAGSAIRTWTIVFNIEELGSRVFADLIYMEPAAGGKRLYAVQVHNKSADSVDLKLIYGGYKGYKYASTITIQKKVWYMAVIRLHPENMSSRAINKMSFFVQTLDNMKKGNVLTGISVREIQANDETHIFNDIARDRRDTCKLRLGTNVAEKKFHYAWVHGFDDVIETSDREAWIKEATKTWQGRWFE